MVPEGKENAAQFAYSAFKVAETVAPAGDSTYSEACVSFGDFDQRWLKPFLAHQGLESKPLRRLDAEVIETALAGMPPGQLAAMIVASRQPEGTLIRMSNGKGGFDNLDLAERLDEKCQDLRGILKEYSDVDLRKVLLASVVASMYEWTHRRPNILGSTLAEGDIVAMLVKREQGLQASQESFSA